jgi:UDP-glucose 4-epimerase
MGLCMSARAGILLIGGNGFLGGALARALARAGREVHVLSRSAEAGQRDGIAFHRGSQDDIAIVAPLLKECRTVIHLASTTTPGSSARSPGIDTEENLLPATMLTKAMSVLPPDRLVFVSSGGAVYGNPERLPVDESCALRPLSYHAAGKVALEALFSAFAHANGVSLAILRPSNIYGPGQPLRCGFGLVRTLLEKALRGEAVEMWGDGSAVRDYLNIDDVVEACTRLIDNAQASGLFNAGSGTGTSIKDLITLVAQVTGRAPRIIERPARGTDVRAIVLDCTRLHAATAWKPTVALQEGLERTWTWVQETAT